MTRKFFIRLIACLALASCARHPPDAELRLKFAQHESVLGVIAQDMAAQPGFVSVWEEGTRRDGSEAVRDDLWTRIWPRLRQTGVKGVMKTQEGAIVFTVSDHGPFSGDSGKGFEYHPQAEPALVASLDRVDLDCGQTYYSQLTKGWYLFLQSYCS